MKSISKRVRIVKRGNYFQEVPEVKDEGFVTLMWKAMREIKRRKLSFTDA